ncbi:MAG: hypothetical protein IKC83_00260 [Clostridia bacterium]|nr:hypothetical protein [Clostridia bacterium]
MKFDKFGVFPKTPSTKSTANNLFDLQSLVKLLPSLLSKRNERTQSENEIKPDNTATIKTQLNPNNTKAYCEFLQKHDEFVKNINSHKE